MRLDQRLAQSHPNPVQLAIQRGSLGDRAGTDPTDRLRERIEGFAPLRPKRRIGGQLVLQCLPQLRGFCQANGTIMGNDIGIDRARVNEVERQTIMCGSQYILRGQPLGRPICSVEQPQGVQQRIRFGYARMHANLHRQPAVAVRITARDGNRYRHPVSRMLHRIDRNDFGTLDMQVHHPFSGLLPVSLHEARHQRALRTGVHPHPIADRSVDAEQVGEHRGMGGLMRPALSGHFNRVHAVNPHGGRCGRESEYSHQQNSQAHGHGTPLDGYSVTHNLSGDAGRCQRSLCLAAHQDLFHGALCGNGPYNTPPLLSSRYNPCRDRILDLPAAI